MFERIGMTGVIIEDRPHTEIELIWWARVRREARDEHERVWELSPASAAALRAIMIDDPGRKR